MYGTARDTAPTLLIPSAWILTYGVHEGLVSEQPMLIAHIVMIAFIASFVLTGYKKMMEGALRGWLIVLVIGFFITALGTAGFFLEEYTEILHNTSVWGWMILPALGLVYTAVETEDKIYYSSAILSSIGAILYPILSFEFVIIFVIMGQTMGIIKAVFDSKL